MCKMSSSLLCFMGTSELDVTFTVILKLSLTFGIIVLDFPKDVTICIVNNIKFLSVISPLRELKNYTMYRSYMNKIFLSIHTMSKFFLVFETYSE